MNVKTIYEFKEFARKKFQISDGLSSGYDNPIDFLYSLDWEVFNGSAFPEEQVSLMNIELDQRSCLGRSARAAVIAEQFFPEAELFSGEVYEDFFRTLLVKNATEENWHDETYIEEILQYENPHTVIIYKDLQFDPIFKIFKFKPGKMVHLKVGKLSLWEGLYCSYLVSEALVAKQKNVMEAFEILLFALTICPDMILLKENLMGIYGLLYEFDKVVELGKSVKEKRKDARNLFVLWSLTEDDSYKEQIISEYSLSMFNYLNPKS
jgi:hypothetical protein